MVFERSLNLPTRQVFALSVFMTPIKFAFITFPIAAFFLTLPYLIFQYRKYGYINTLRSFILYSMLLYCITAYYLVILPLPSSRDTCSLLKAGAAHMQLTPFTFLRDFLNETHVIWSRPATYLQVLKERAFQQAVFNVLLLVPFGIYLRYYFQKSWFKTLILTFLVSLFFEVTQLTGLYGLYNCPYRLFDVDDLFLNTLGGICGYILAPLFTFFFPKADELDANVDLARKQVGFIRRFIAMSIDWFIIGIIIAFMTGIKFRISVLPKFGDWSNLQQPIVYIFAVFIYFILIPYFTKGITAGKWLMRIHVQGQAGAPSFRELLARYGWLYYGLFGVNYVLSSSLLMNSDYPLAILASFMIFMIINGLMFVHVLLHLFKKDKRLFYEKISGTKNAIILKKEETASEQTK